VPFIRAADAITCNLVSIWTVSVANAGDSRTPRFRFQMLHQLHNTPVEKSRDTMGQYMFEMICSETHHADKAPKMTGMILDLFHGDGSLVD